MKQVYRRTATAAAVIIFIIGRITFFKYQFFIYSSFNAIKLMLINARNEIKLNFL